MSRSWRYRHRYDLNLSTQTIMTPAFSKVQIEIGPAIVGVEGAEQDRLVEGVDGAVWNYLCVAEFQSWANAQDINRQGYGEPEEPGPAAGTRFGRFHGGSCALVCGRFGHGGNIKQWRGFLQKETK